MRARIILDIINHKRETFTSTFCKNKEKTGKITQEQHSITTTTVIILITITFVILWKDTNSKLSFINKCNYLD